MLSRQRVIELVIALVAIAVIYFVVFPDPQEFARFAESLKKIAAPAGIFTALVGIAGVIYLVKANPPDHVQRRAITIFKWTTVCGFSALVAGIAIYVKVRG